MDVKPGYKTSEFQVVITTIVGAVLTALVIMGVISEAEKEVIAAGIAGLVVLVATVAAIVARYTESRTRIKEAAAAVELAELEQASKRVHPG